MSESWLVGISFMLLHILPTEGMSVSSLAQIFRDRLLRGLCIDYGPTDMLEWSDHYCGTSL